jgi:hypothetical protein
MENYTVAKALRFCARHGIYCLLVCDVIAYMGFLLFVRLWPTPRGHRTGAWGCAITTHVYLRPIDSADQTATVSATLGLATTPLPLRGVHAVLNGLLVHLSRD